VRHRLCWGGDGNGVRASLPPVWAHSPRPVNFLLTQKVSRRKRLLIRVHLYASDHFASTRSMASRTCARAL
jgi:hypothetical protein